VLDGQNVSPLLGMTFWMLPSVLKLSLSTPTSRR
jgi:hypothetical protein